MSLKYEPASEPLHMRGGQGAASNPAVVLVREGQGGSGDPRPETCRRTTGAPPNHPSQISRSAPGKHQQTHRCRPPSTAPSATSQFPCEPFHGVRYLQIPETAEPCPNLRLPFLAAPRAARHGTCTDSLSRKRGTFPNRTPPNANCCAPSAPPRRWRATCTGPVASPASSVHPAAASAACSPLGRVTHGARFCNPPTAFWSRPREPLTLAAVSVAGRPA